MAMNMQRVRQVGCDAPGLAGALQRLDFISGITDAEQQKDVFKGWWQREGVEFMLKREFTEGVKGGLLCDEMGLGKTYQILALLACNVCKTLILCPVNVVHQWTVAVRNFLGEHPYVLSTAWKNEGIPSRDEVIIIAPLSMFSTGKTPAFLRQWEFSRIVIDEGHMMRNKKTSLFKNIDCLMGNIKWVATGTPIHNSLNDLCSLTDWIGFKEKKNLVAAVKKDYMIRRTLTAVMPDMPNLIQHTEVLEFTPLEQAVYDYVENDLGNGPEVETYILEAIMRCRQICVSPLVYLQSVGPMECTHKKATDIFDKYSIDKRCVPEELRRLIANSDRIPSTKLAWVVDNIIEHSDEKCIVFCSWLREMTIVENMLRQHKVTSVSYNGSMTQHEKEGTLIEFEKQKRVRVIIMQINCAGVGLNIQTASRVYILSPNWNPCIESQAIGRAHRLGQTRPVTAIRVIMKNTVDERCLQVQQRKAGTIVDVLDDLLLKERLHDASFQELKYIFRGKQKKRRAEELEAAKAKKPTPV